MVGPFTHTPFFNTDSEGKLDDLDQQIADATTALHGLVDELRLVRFQRFAAAMVIGVVALRHLFTPPEDGQPPTSTSGNKARYSALRKQLLEAV